MDLLLRQHFPNITYTTPKGGYFFWLRLPRQMNAIELRQQAKAFKVDFRQGSLFSSIGGSQNYIRLCFAHYDEEHIEEGILRLKECLETR